jgi:site-specific recombinase XerD
MLHRYIDKFFDYSRLAGFSSRSVQALTARINEFDTFLKKQRIRSIKRVSYRHLVDFAADYKNPSIHVTKSRVWTLRQFYHFLTLYRIVPKNIATGIPYPKIEKTVPQFLTEDEYKRLIRHFTERADSSMGLRNLIIIMLLGTLGLRTSTLTALNIEDIELMCGTMWVKEKGRQHRSIVLPHSLCKMIHKYLQPRYHQKGCRKKGPLLLSIRKKRISPRTLQDIFRSAADQVGIDKKLHARLFRHTAATHLTKVSDTDITQHVLGHRRRVNTLKYAHLNPDRYGVYMKKHPFMNQEAP